MNDQLLPSQLAFHKRPELTFLNTLGQSSAEFVLGILAVYCHNYNSDSFVGVSTGQFFAFLLNYEESDFPKDQKFTGLMWLMDKQLIMQSNSTIIVPTDTLNILSDFRREQQVHSAIAAHH